MERKFLAAYQPQIAEQPIPGDSHPAIERNNMQMAGCVA